MQTQEQPALLSKQAVSARVASVDIFRGLTIAVMIFVNDLAGVKGLPWWTYHAPRNVDVMTYVDMVFPAFLFILGMSMPLAVEQRLKKSSMGHLWLHVLLRTAGLVVLGLILANAHKGDPALMRMPRNVWPLLAVLGAVLFWNVYGRSERYRILFRVLRFSGLATLVILFAIFRRTTHDGHVAWIDISYWEILGLIGWTYLAVSILYIPARKWRFAPLIWFVLLLFLNVLSAAKMIPLAALPFYIWPFGSGAFASMAMAGVVTSTLFLVEQDQRTFRQKAILAFLFAAVTLLAGWILTPLGISKIRETPTWCLYSVGASVLLFTALYWICDVKKQTGWASLLRPAGSNPLMTYLLPDLYAFAFRGTYLATHFRIGWPGVLKSVVFTAAILGIAALLTRAKVRMQL